MCGGQFATPLGQAIGVALQHNPVRSGDGQGHIAVGRCDGDLHRLAGKGSEHIPERTVPLHIAGDRGRCTTGSELDARDHDREWPVVFVIQRRVAAVEDPEPHRVRLDHSEIADQTRSNPP